MIYNNHVAYKVDLKPEDFADLASEKNIVAVKESSHDSRRITDMINLLGDRYAIVCGVDDLFLENALFGAVGWVSGLANSFPREAVQLFRLAKAGAVAEALELYRWFMPLLHLDVATKLVQYIKLANQMTGEGSEWVRAPRLTLEGEERKRISRDHPAGASTRARSSRWSPEARRGRGRRHRRRRHRRPRERLQARRGRPLACCSSTARAWPRKRAAAMPARSPSPTSCRSRPRTCWRKLPRWLSDPLGPFTVRPEYLPQITPWMLRFWRAGWPDRVAAGDQGAGAR